MLIYSIIQKSQLEGAKRLDAEYYQPEYLDIAYKLRSNKFYKKFGDILIRGNYGILPDSEDYILKKNENENIFLIRGVDLRGVKIEEENLIKVPKKYINERALAKEGDLVFLVKGATIDAEDSVGIIPKLDKKAIFNGSIYRPVLKDVLSEFAYIFMRTEYFYKQKRRLVSNIGIEYNSVQEIKSYDFIVPSIDFQNLIKVEVRKIFEVLNNSKFLYQQAENLLLEELDFKDFNIEENLSSVVNLSDIKSFHRMDAEYFQLKYKKLIEKIISYPNKNIEEVAENVSAKFDASKKPSEIFKYVELSNINSSSGIIDGFSEVFGKEAPSRAKRILKIRDVIVSSVEGSLNKVALVDKEQNGYLASTGFFQLRSKEILPEVLLVISKSIVFQLQLEKQCAGTILTAVPKEAIRNIIIPILPKETQQKISDLVQKSHEARKKAKELLEEAKRKVEEMIEK